MFVFVKLISLFSVISCVSVSAISDPVDGSPGEIAQKYVLATLHHDLEEAVKWVHPEATDWIKSVYIASYRGEQDDALMSTIFGTSTLEEFELMASQEVWVRSLRYSMKIDPQTRDLLQSASIDLVGLNEEEIDDSSEGPELIHVVYRIRIDGVPPKDNHVALVTLKKHDGAWRALFSKEFKLRHF